MDGPEHEERFTRERLTELLHALSDALKERGQRGARFRGPRPAYRYRSAPGPTGSPASIQTTSISDQQARKTTV